MGHVVDSQREYRLLQNRLQHSVTGAPDSPVLGKILQLLFSPEEVALARRLPYQLTPLTVLSRRLGIPSDELDAKMTEMAQRGLVFDMERDGQRYLALPPLVIGFYEFTFMRTRDDLPLPELARLFDQYLGGNDGLYHSLFGGATQIGRTLVREEALPKDDHTEILDWERASHVLRSATAVGVSLCTCRHKKSHSGEACRRPLDCCLSLNYAAEMVIRNGFARPITTDRAMRILEECKQAGLAQTADNVRHKVAYICNCCGCCCTMFEAINKYDVRGAIVTSNWIMDVNPARCKGCGKCAEVCPVRAIEMVGKGDGRGNHKQAVCDQSLCLGCGVCYSACKSGAVTMKSRSQRVFTPQNVFDRTVSMAIERGKLADLLFDDPETLSHRALGRIVGGLERASVVKAVMAIKPLRSVFLKGVIRGAKKRLGKVGDELA